jgi:hypothetical protein
VQVARSAVSRYRSSSALVAIGYIAFDVSAQALLVVARSDKLERLGLFWVRSVERSMNKPKELCAKIVVFRDY